MTAKNIFMISLIALLASVACQNTTKEQLAFEKSSKESNAHENLIGNQETLSTKEIVTRISGDELDSAVTEETIFILDVRQPDEISSLGTVNGYTNIPIDELAGRLDELPRDRPILTA